jgi:hypothetical protein
MKLNVADTLNALLEERAENPNLQGDSIMGVVSQGGASIYFAYEGVVDETTFRDLAKILAFRAREAT